MRFHGKIHLFLVQCPAYDFVCWKPPVFFIQFSVFSAQSMSSWDQKIKLKNFLKTQKSRKCQDLFCLKNPKSMLFMYQIPHKIPELFRYCSQKTRNFRTLKEAQEFSKTKGQNRPNFCKNSRFRILHLPIGQKKRLNKPDFLRSG